MKRVRLDDDDPTPLRKYKRVRLYDDYEQLPYPLNNHNGEYIKHRQDHKHKLSMLEERMVQKYIACRNRALACLQAGYSPRTLGITVKRLFEDPRILNAIAEHDNEAWQKAKYTLEDALQRLATIAMTDWNFGEVIRFACRHCWGENSHFQFNAVEMEHAINKHFSLRGKNRPFNPQGGEGYDITLDPNPGCPVCNGVGEERVYIKDTRTLPPQVRALISGIEHSGKGVLIKTHNQLDALKAFIGFGLDIRRMASERTLDPEALNDEEIDQVLVKAAQRGELSIDDGE